MKKSAILGACLLSVAAITASFASSANIFAESNISPTNSTSTQPSSLTDSTPAQSNPASPSSLSSSTSSPSLASTPISISDQLEVVVEDACTLTRTSGSGNYTATMLPSELNNNFATSTYHVFCNDADGFKIDAAFTSLAGPGEDITYSAENPTADSGTWTASVTTDGITTNIPAENGTLMTNPGITAPDGQSATITYKVSTKNNQAAGTYTGTATYTLNRNS